MCLAIIPKTRNNILIIIQISLYIGVIFTNKNLTWFLFIFCLGVGLFYKRKKGIIFSSLITAIIFLAKIFLDLRNNQQNNEYLDNKMLLNVPSSKFDMPIQNSAQNDNSITPSYDKNDIETSELSSKNMDVKNSDSKSLLKTKNNNREFREDITGVNNSIIEMTEHANLEDVKHEDFGLTTNKDFLPNQKIQRPKIIKFKESPDFIAFDVNDIHNHHLLEDIDKKNSFKINIENIDDKTLNLNIINIPKEQKEIQKEELASFTGNGKLYPRKNSGSLKSVEGSLGHKRQLMDDNAINYNSKLPDNYVYGEINSNLQPESTNSGTKLKFYPNHFYNKPKKDDETFEEKLPMSDFEILTYNEGNSHNNKDKYTIFSNDESDFSNSRLHSDNLKQMHEIKANHDLSLQDEQFKNNINSTAKNNYVNNEKINNTRDVGNIRKIPNKGDFSATNNNEGDGFNAKINEKQSYSAKSEKKEPKSLPYTEKLKNNHRENDNRPTVIFENSENQINLNVEDNNQKISSETNFTHKNCNNDKKLSLNNFEILKNEDFHLYITKIKILEFDPFMQEVDSLLFYAKKHYKENFFSYVAKYLELTSDDKSKNLEIIMKEINGLALESKKESEKVFEVKHCIFYNMLRTFYIPNLNTNFVEKKDYMIDLNEMNDNTVLVDENYIIQIMLENIKYDELSDDEFCFIFILK